MSCHPTAYLLRRSRSSYHQLSLQSARISPNTYVHRLPYLSFYRSETFSTSGRRSNVEAAPEINLNDFKEVPARIIPASRSYFSSVPRFTDALLLLQDLYQKHERLPTVLAIHAPRRAWVKYPTYKSSLGEKVQLSRFNKLLALLHRLNRIHPQLMPREVRDTLLEYVQPGDPNSGTPKVQTVDEDGKAFGIGRRKASTAKVFLVEGDGEVLINGKSIVKAFPRLHDRESAIWPLKVTERVDKYNIWALVNGGGLTGQAESITLGLARALLIHEPLLKPILRKAGCITRDRRRVERKKHGHLKARKMPAWVKR